jgi:hypothetical protein
MLLHAMFFTSSTFLYCRFKTAKLFYVLKWLLLIDYSRPILLIWISANCFRSLARLWYYQLANITRADHLGTSYPNICFLFNRRASCSVRLCSLRWNDKRKDNFWFLGLLLKWSKIRVLPEYKLLEWPIVTKLSDSLIPLTLPFFKLLLINLSILTLFLFNFLKHLSVK